MCLCVSLCRIDFRFDKLFKFLGLYAIGFCHLIEPLASVMYVSDDSVCAGHITNVNLESSINKTGHRTA